VLSNKGVKVDYPQALKMLDKAGVKVDLNSHQVRFPRDIIEAALRKVPRSLTLAARNERHDIVIPHPRGMFYTRNGSGARSYLDPDSNTYRDITLAYVKECAQLVEVLDEIHFCAFPSPTDAPVQTADIHALKILLENTSKHINVQPYSVESIEYLLQLAMVVSGSAEALQKRPIISLNPNAFTPLGLKAYDVEVIIQSSRYGIPIHVCSLPSAGGTSPVTIAGTVLLLGIEILAMIVVSQLIKPGTPVIALPLPFTLDMLTGNNLGSGVEAVLAEAATVQFIKEAYHIPVHTYGFGTDSPVPDGQSMIEVTLKGLLASMTGSDILSGAGFLDAVRAFSLVQLVIDDTLIGILKRVNAGVKVDDDTLAWKEILDTVPGSHFLERDHTLKHCREALRPELFVRVPAEMWSLEGGKDFYARALEKYRELKKQLKPQELPEEVQRELNRIVKQADKHLVK
jgi:trimethylamine:corrinoid methyltransferase-like protein